jgi:hypothetical protein
MFDNKMNINPCVKFLSFCIRAEINFYFNVCYQRSRLNELGFIPCYAKVILLGQCFFLNIAY